MKIISERNIIDLKPVLLFEVEKYKNPVYRVFTEIEEGNWVNKTVIKSDKLGNEYSKTFGHYHGVLVNERYFVKEGEGILQLQKKHFENSKWIPEIIDQVYLIRAKRGDQLVITPEWGHSWSNSGEGDLILLDDWSSGHTPADYEIIEKLKGLAYYLVDEKGEIEVKPNKNYAAVPPPIWISASEFNLKFG